VIFFPTNNPDERLYGTFSQSPTPGQPVIFSLRPEDLEKMPKDPSSVSMVFDRLLTSPQSGILVPSTNGAPKFTLLSQESVTREGKGTFTPFDNPSLMITGLIIPPPDPNQSPKFIADRPDQMSLLAKDGSRSIYFLGT
jgi:hypothetical protein